MRRSYPLFQRETPSGKWEWYFLMQHYDLPTRLLDWSESSLVGLFFAVYDYRQLKAGGDYRSREKSSGKKKIEKRQTMAAVWMMDPVTLNRQSLGTSFAEGWPLLRHDDELIQKYLSYRPGTDKHEDGSPYEWPANPVAIMPPSTNPRLTAQKGMFVLFGLEDVALESRFNWNSSGDPRLIKYEIPAHAIPEMRVNLRRAGITPALLFPELSMLSSDILQGWLT
jgi:FRG domain